MELTEPLISLENVSFGYTRNPVLKDISLSIGRGEIVTLLGPNGCGKSTLIKVMLGMLKPSQGRVAYEGTEVSHLGARHLAREIAYVPQLHRSAFPYLVIDVALMGRIPHKTFFFKYSKHDLDIAYDALRRLSILHLAERPYTEISGGERQLTIIARALAQEARTLIMDEPASGLDYGNQLRLLEQISGLAGEGYTFIKSTHSRARPLDRGPGGHDQGGCGHGGWELRRCREQREPFSALQRKGGRREGRWLVPVLRAPGNR